MNKIYYYYDKEADVLYFSQGKPSRKDESKEADDDVVLRIDPTSGKIKGFTILNFSKRNKEHIPLSLPIQGEFTASPK